MARRHSTPPYEIMGRRLPEPSGEGAAEEGAVREGEGPGADRPATTHGRGGRARVVSGLSEPVVLRVPRGLAVLAIVAVLGLIVLGYAVGHRRGYGAGEAAEAGRAEEELRMVTRLAQRQVDGALGAGRGDGTGGGESSETGREGRFDDPRRRGLRYFVVSHEPADEAARLIAFVERSGVDAAAVPSDNPRFVKVIATQGFTADELRSATGRDYEQALRQIGRAWKDANNGRGKDLSDLYPELYEG